MESHKAYILGSLDCIYDNILSAASTLTHWHKNNPMQKYPENVILLILKESINQGSAME